MKNMKMVKSIAAEYGFGEESLPEVLQVCHSLLDEAMEKFPSAPVAILAILGLQPASSLEAAVKEIAVAIIHKSLAKEMAKEVFH